MRLSLLHLSHESAANMLSLSFVLSTRDVKFRKIAFRNVICFKYEFIKNIRIFKHLYAVESL